MGKNITRRNFIKRGAALAASSSVWNTGFSKISEAVVNSDFTNKHIDIAVTIGDGYFENTIKAIKILGGMIKFVPKNSSMLLLGNVWRVPGTFTKPDIFRATARMCWEA